MSATHRCRVGSVAQMGMSGGMSSTPTVQMVMTGWVNSGIHRVNSRIHWVDSRIHWVNMLTD
jgi:hypothetical protein